MPLAVWARIKQQWAQGRVGLAPVTSPRAWNLHSKKIQHRVFKSALRGIHYPPRATLDLVWMFVEYKCTTWKCVLQVEGLVMDIY